MIGKARALSTRVHMVSNQLIRFCRPWIQALSSNTTETSIGSRSRRCSTKAKDRHQWDRIPWRMHEALMYCSRVIVFIRQNVSVMKIDFSQTCDRDDQRTVDFEIDIFVGPRRRFCRREREDSNGTAHSCRQAWHLSNLTDGRNPSSDWTVQLRCLIHIILPSQPSDFVVLLTRTKQNNRHAPIDHYRTVILEIVFRINVSVCFIELGNACSCWLGLHTIDLKAPETV